MQGERNLWQRALMSQPARFSLDECCVGPQPDKMGANTLEPTNIVIARCSLFHFLYVTVCLCPSRYLSPSISVSPIFLPDLRKRVNLASEQPPCPFTNQHAQPAHFHKDVLARALLKNRSAEIGSLAVNVSRRSERRQL